MKAKAESITRVLQENGHEAVFAGGCVRDSLLGYAPKDYDVATSATPKQVEALFDKTLAVGRSFGVVVVMDGDDQIEVATFRTDGKYSDGRRPDSVSFSSMEEDAARRDFTINSMFLDPTSGKRYDFFGGESDLRDRTLRFVGDPTGRIKEDNLRLLRFVRFLVRFDLTPSKSTAKAVRRNASLVECVSRERVTQELFKMLALGKSRRVVEALDAYGLLQHILPAVSALKWVEQPKKYHPEGDVWVHTMQVLTVLDNENAPTIVKLAGLLHDIGKPTTQTFDGRIRFNGHDKEGASMIEVACSRLRLSNNDMEKVTYLVRNHMRPMVAPKMKRSKLTRMLAHEWIADLLLISKADSLGGDGNLDDYNFLAGELASFVPLPDPLISGRDLINEGMDPGPWIGKVLRTARDAQLNGTITTAREALALAKSTVNK